MMTVERWDFFELTLTGPRQGNPYLQESFGARFRHDHREISVNGFYDGNGTYCVRFMPDTQGEWHFETFGSDESLAGKSGSFECVAPSEGNHGPVRVTDRYHFAYADGTPYYQVGTTCYAWVHQGDELEELTLQTLASAPFNKLRMCLFPKHYAYNQNEPQHHLFERGGEGDLDWERFNPAFFRHLEERILALRDLGIQADLILFHPYDRWGYAEMPAEADDRYLRYVVARLAAYRNIWWSMANEYDLMESKTMADWDRFFRIVQESDPYQHPRSIHNCRGFYDHGKPWVTHQSVQHSEPEKTAEWRQLYGKPVVIDECKYEGDIPYRWGNIPAQELVRKFWEATVRGGYCGHGETYLHPEDILWWSKGGRLHGTSAPRIAFLKKALEEGPAQGFEPRDGIVRSRFPCVSKDDLYLLIYFGIQQPAIVPLRLPQGCEYTVDLVDTWEMTRTRLDGTFAGECEIEIPAKPYQALLLQVKDEG